MQSKRNRLKHLEFDGKFREKIVTGKKRVTIRKRTKLKPGDFVFVHCGGKIIGKAKIISVKRRKLEELTDQEAKLDGFEDRSDLIQKLTDLGYHDGVYVIEFEFVPTNDINPYELHYGSVALDEIARKALECLNLSKSEKRILNTFLKEGSIRKAAKKLGSWKKRNEIRCILRKCYLLLREMRKL